MSERLIDPKALEEAALCFTSHLKEIAVNHERQYPEDIEVVLVFSGPGTYYERLKPNEPEWMRWMDRDRIRAGVAVVREVTASAKSCRSGYTIRSSEISPSDIEGYGPLFVYNGVGEENSVLLKALDSPFCLLPKEKVIVLDTVRHDDGQVYPIHHTGDQVQSFFQALADPSSPIFGKATIATVAHIPDYIRIPFYLRKYNDAFIADGHRGCQFLAYALRNRPGTEDLHVASELPRLVAYAKQGDLSLNPVDFSA